MKRRLGAVRTGYNSAVSNTDRLQAAIELEHCFLQIRLLIELLAVETLCAHNEIEEFRTASLVKTWNAESLINRLKHMSDDAFPKPITVTDPGPDGVADLYLHEHDRHRTQVLKLYSRCGECLHTGALRSILRDDGRTYDSEEIRIALNFLVAWVDQHAILLPGGSRMLVSFLRYAPTNDVHCFLTDFSPDKVFDPRTFPTP